MTHKKLVCHELEKYARSTTVKLPKLKITSFKGTPTGGVRFSNMFVTQVHAKPMSAKEKSGYLLEESERKHRELETWRSGIQNRVNKAEERVQPDEACNNRSRGRNHKPSHDKRKGYKSFTKK